MRYAWTARRQVRIIGVPPLSLLELYWHIDAFCQQFERPWQQHHLAASKPWRRRSGQLSVREILTIVIHFHQAHYCDFKAYYLQNVAVQLRAEFPSSSATSGSWY